MAVRYVGLSGRAIVHALLLIEAYRLGRYAVLAMAKPLNEYSLGELGAYVGMAGILMFLTVSFRHPPEDEATLRLWALSAMLMLSAGIFALVVWLR